MTIEELHKKLERGLDQYTQLVAFALCRGKCSAKMEVFGDRHTADRWPHHKGAFSKLISGDIRLTNEQINKWALDTEHGLLHGFLVGFWAYMQKYDFSLPDEIFANFMDPNSEALADDFTVEIEPNAFTEEEIHLPSYIFHDFIRCTESHKDHDKNLRKLFASFAEETYNHSNPDTDGYLVQGDRTELIRFADWRSWCKFDVLKKYYTDEQSRHVLHFYRYIRPILERLFRYRYDTWCRHSVEEPQNYDLKSGIEFYPKTYTNEENSDYYAIEIGSMPLRGCILHSADRWSPYGLISLTDLKGHGAVFKSLPNRDHLGACGKTPFDAWVFATTEDNPIDELLTLSAGFLDIALINKILSTTTLIIDNLRVLRT